MSLKVLKYSAVIGAVSGLMSIYLFIFGLHDGILFLSFINGGFWDFLERIIEFEIWKCVLEGLFFSRKLNMS